MAALFQRLCYAEWTASAEVPDSKESKVEKHNFFLIFSIVMLFFLAFLLWIADVCRLLIKVARNMSLISVVLTIC
jgi:hypothetical protein